MQGLGLPSLGAFLVIGVWILIAFIAFTTQFYVFLPWVHSVHTGFINVLVAYICLTYYISVSRSPGTPALSPGGDKDENLKMCRKCDRIKPPRCHHCKTCQTCVLRMDHHCPFLNNCLGYRNHGVFICFLLSVDVCVGYIFWELLLRAYDIYLQRNEPSYLGPSTVEIVFTILNILLCFGILISVGVLTVHQLKNLAINMTTIEEWEAEHHETLVDEGRADHVEFPYDIGIYENLKAVLGPCPWLWLWPWATAVGDGFSFPTNGFSDAGWPPPTSDYKKYVYSPAGVVPAIEIESEYLSRGDEEQDDSEDSWENLNGETLGDFGVDVDTEQDTWGSLVE